MDTENAKTAAPALSTAAISALYQGNKIEAIKIIREERGLGLKEAKDAVEDYVRGHPALQSSLAGAQAQVKRSVLLWVATLIIGALLVYQFLVKQ
jgi:ribosomal protein L7/L12